MTCRRYRRRPFDFSNTFARDSEYRNGISDAAIPRAIASANAQNRLARPYLSASYPMPPTYYGRRAVTKHRILAMPALVTAMPLSYEIKSFIVSTFIEIGVGPSHFERYNDAHIFAARVSSYLCA